MSIERGCPILLPFHNNCIIFSLESIILVAPLPHFIMSFSSILSYHMDPLYFIFFNSLSLSSSNELLNMCAKPHLCRYNGQEDGRTYLSIPSILLTNPLNSLYFLSLFNIMPLDHVYFNSLIWDRESSIILIVTRLRTSLVLKELCFSEFLIYPARRTGVPCSLHGSRLVYFSSFQHKKY